MRKSIAIASATVAAVLVVAGIWLWLGASGGKRSAEQGRASGNRDFPNVLLISMDTTRRDHIGFYGYERDTTPELDRRVAQRGVVFETAVAPHTNTAPSHASMLTGLYATAHGVRRNGMKLRSDIEYLPAILEEHGYATGAFVSGWTLGAQTQLDRGFGTYNDELPGPGRREAAQALDAALPWLREHAQSSDPFFMFFHVFDPHYPYAPPDEDLHALLPANKAKPKTPTNHPRLPGPKARARLTQAEVDGYVLRYDAEIHDADRHIGRLLQELEDSGVASNTLVIFVSDHGETLFERHWVFDHGGRAYDEQIRVPLAIRFPEKRYAGRRIEAQVSLVDLTKTVLDYLKLPTPGGVSGRSLMELVGDDDGQWTDPRAVYAQARPEPARLSGAPSSMVKKGLLSTIRLPSVKLIEYPTRGGSWYQELFDLEGDPGEQRNIAQAKTDLVDRLHGELERWREATGGSERKAPPELSPEAEEQLRSLGYVE